MNRKYTQSMTLRLEPQLDDLVADAAFDRRTTKASWIRAAIRRSLKIDNAPTGRLDNDQAVLR